jgi:hypothetical protein
MHKHQPDEHEANDGVVGDPHMQKLERGECGRCRTQKTEMNGETGSSAPDGPALNRWLEIRVLHLARRHRSNIEKPGPYGNAENRIRLVGIAPLAGQ